MEILHIIPVGGVSVIPLAELLQRCDKQNRHIFLVTTPFQTVLKKNMDLLRIRDLRHTPVFGHFSAIRKMCYLYKLTKAADRVVWHTFKTNGGYSPFFLLFFRDILKKSLWIPCEGEIGNYVNVSHKFLNRYVRRVNHFIQRNIAWIGLNCASDEALLKEFEILKPQVRVLPYVVGEHKQNALDLCVGNPSEMVEKRKIFVQMGLSSQLGNQHGHLLDVLCGLSDQPDACVFVPFRYIIPGIRYAGGTKNYMNKVRTEAKKLAARTVYLDKMVSVEAYVKHLSKMDIVLLGNGESIQMGMLTCLLAMKKRIFMDQNAPLYHHLNMMGAGIHSLDELKEAGSLAEAMAMSEACLPDALLHQYTAENVLEQWMNWSAEEK